jgi:hypothetical protein
LLEFAICRREGALMSLEQWIMLPFAVALFAFIVFAFRQGFKVKPDHSGTPPDEIHWRSSGRLEP